MSEQNGRRELDLSSLVETLHIKAGEVEFDLPLDIPVPLLGRMQAVGSRLEKAEGLDDVGLEKLDGDLWAIADALIARANPAPGPARNFLTLPALLELVRFLTAGFGSTQPSTTPSSSPTTTAEPSPSPTSSAASPS